MKKILIIFIFVLSFQYSANLASADYAQSLKDYSYQFEKYRTAHQNYTVSKNKYLTYNTPVSLAEALENGKIIISYRDMVLLTYFQALKDKVSETKNIPPETLINISSEIDKELAFLSANKDKAQSTISLYDLTQVSKEVENKQIELQNVAKSAIGAILTTRVESLRNLIDLNQDYLSYTVSQNKNILENSVNMERWLIESKNKIVLAGQKIGDSGTEFNSEQTYSGNSVSESLAKAELMLVSANQYLKEALNFQLEVIRGITND